MHRTLQCTATHYNTLQHTATHHKTLQHTPSSAYRRGSSARIGEVQQMNTVTHCNALQRTATHCNTPQQTATHRNTPQNIASHTLLCIPEGQRRANREGPSTCDTADSHTRPPRRFPMRTMRSDTRHLPHRGWAVALRNMPNCDMYKCMYVYICMFIRVYVYCRFPMRTGRDNTCHLPRRG